MPDSTVAALPAAVTLDGTELYYGVQAGGDTKVTGAQIKTLASTSPTLVTPTLGVAAGTSIALGGATIGSNALAVTGASLFNTSVTIGAGSAITSSGPGGALTANAFSSTTYAPLASPTFTGIVTTPAIDLSGNISSAAWTTAGVKLKSGASTLTDTTSTGTVAVAYTDKLGGNSIAASNSTVFTDYYTLFVSNPNNGANVSFTRSWSLGLEGGLNAASANLGGATTVLGTNKLAVTGTSLLAGVVMVNGGLGSTAIVLTDGATPALDASLGNLFTLDAAGDRTIAVPSNPSSGQKIVIRHFASGGARTLALNTGAGGFSYGSDITGLTQTASGKYDYIGCIWNAATSFWNVVAYVKGY